MFEGACNRGEWRGLVEHLGQKPGLSDRSFVLRRDQKYFSNKIL